jgi:diguanylate cyclase (GGDEF)-like protein
MEFSRQILMTTLALLLISAVAHGSTSSTMRFDRLSVEDGLSQSAVMAIAQDASGFIWVATESGLDRYDGHTFRNYRHERGNPESISNSFVRDISVDNRGGLWIATDGGGVSYWNPDSGTFTNWRFTAGDPNSIASDQIRSVVYDPRGYVWIGTRDAGLDRLTIESNEVTHFRHVPNDAGSISSNAIYAITLTEADHIWVGTDNGLNRLDPVSGINERIVTDPAGSGSALLANKHVRSLLVDSDGIVWIGTNAAGLYRLDPGAEALTQYKHEADNPASIRSNRIERIIQDDAGRLWFGTDRGLHMMNADRVSFTAFQHDPADTSSLSDNYIFSIFQDRGGELWIGTRSGGLNKWNPRTWTFGHFRPGDDQHAKLSNTNITSFAEDDAGRLWVGTFGGGINIISTDYSSIDVLRADSEQGATISGDRVMALLKSRDGTIWAGTLTAGLNRIDPGSGSVTTYRHSADDPASLAADGVMALYEDQRGRLWVGTFGGGISRFDAGNDGFVTITHQPGNGLSLSNNRVTSITEDRLGSLWVGTDGGGLNRSSDGGRTWQRLEHSNDNPASLSSNSIYALLADDKGSLWVATRGGLDRITRESGGDRSYTVTSISELADFQGYAPYSLTADHDGNLWMGTERGLIKFDVVTGAPQVFHEDQGLQGSEFNFGAGYTSGRGQLFFGGANGFNRFHPGVLRFNETVPSIALTNFAVWNKPVISNTPIEQMESVELGYRDDSITFEFAALDFAAPEQNRYSYKLEGFDTDWIDAGNERRISYTNLDGGNYTLRVRAANADQRWNEEGLSIPITVHPAPWATWWAYLLYGILVVSALFTTFYRQHMRLQSKAAYSEKLEQDVEQRTLELNNRNDDLKDAIQKLERLSTTDELTGLRNRRYVFDKVSKDADLVLRRRQSQFDMHASSENTDLLFMMIDIDRFKAVNDTYGHEAGDLLLIGIKDVLLESCRSSDDVIRWGGDEFMIVARDANPEYGKTLAERIRSGLSQRVFSIGSGRVARTTASIGFSSFPFIKENRDALLWEDVLGIADAAMYEAKKQKNTWVGIKGIEWEGDFEELLSQAKQDPRSLVADGAIEMIEPPIPVASLTG